MIVGGSESFESVFDWLWSGAFVEGFRGGAEGGDGAVGGLAGGVGAVGKASKVIGFLLGGVFGEGAGFAGGVVDGVGVGEGDALLRGAEFFEFLGAGEDAGLEGTEGLVVVLNGGVQGAAHLGEVVGEGGDA